MQKLMAILCFVSSSSLFANISINEAPLEWLIVETLQRKYKEPKFGKVKDDLLKEISENVSYDIANDELSFKTNRNLNQLKSRLISYLSPIYSKNYTDKAFSRWMKEPTSEISVKLEATNKKIQGYYYFNHVHTDISKDNKDLWFLKHSPSETYNMIRGFINRRRTKGAVAFTDHDADHAFDKITSVLKPDLHPLRGVEWGGKTHMCLIGINEGWPKLPLGREYAEEESIRQSRSSGGFRVVNHPYRKEPGFPNGRWLDADGVEVWNTIIENAPFYIERSNNRKALSDWTKSLQAGKTYTAVAGSDFHFSIPCLQEKTLVYPVNYIPGTDPTQTKKALFDGRVSFLTRAGAPKLTLRVQDVEKRKWVMMGGQIKSSQKVLVELLGDFSDARTRLGGYCYNTVRNFYRLLTFWRKEIWEVRFYDQKGNVIAKQILKPKSYNPKRHLRASFEMPVYGKDIVRAELWAVNKDKKQVDLLGATNPVYINW